MFSSLNCDKTMLEALILFHCREQLGKDLVIVVLTMNSKDRRERVLARHKGDTATADVMDVILGWACEHISNNPVAAF